MRCGSRTAPRGEYDERSTRSSAGSCGRSPSPKPPYGTPTGAVAVCVFATSGPSTATRRSLGSSPTGATRRPGDGRRRQPRRGRGEPGCGLGGELRGCDRSALRPDHVCRGARLRDRPASAGRPSAMAYGEGALWVTKPEDDTVTRIDPATYSTLFTIPVGGEPSPGGGGGSGWGLGRRTRATEPSRRSIPRPTTSSTRSIGNSPAGIVVADGRVWVSARAG